MLVFGKNVINSILNNKSEIIRQIFVNEKNIDEIKKRTNNLKVEVIKLSDSFLDKNKLRHKAHQGIVANIIEPQLLSTKELIERNEEKRNPLILILDQIEDPNNFGTILRNAAAFEVNGVIHSKSHSSPLTATAMKASAGNWINQNIAVDNISNAIKLLKINNYWIISTSINGKTNIEEIINFDRPMAIILGNEKKGVRKSILNNSDFLLKLNISKNVESLNVSSTSAILLNAFFNNK